MMQKKDIPWFKDASVGRILNVEEPTKYHFYWPDLDVDLSLDIIKNINNYLTRIYEYSLCSC